MKNFILTYLLAITSFTLFAQDTWVSFYNKDSSLIGFKDKNGRVKIEPKFNESGTAKKFDDIIAVTEETNESWSSYYLTKAGRMVGKDSLHFFDNTADCESEGFIRFHDPKSDKVGVFNKNGDIVISADYNDLTRVRNGMLSALKGAKKKQWGEHFSWQGGQELLIDTNNHILIENFENADQLNFFSVLVSPQPTTDTIRQSFKGVNGQYYSFIDFDKEFRSWLHSSLLAHFTKKRLLECSYDKITFWKEPIGWTSEAKNSFINRNFELLKSKLFELNSKTCDYAIFDEGLNPYIYEDEEYNKYFNNCGEAKDWIYPIKNIVFSYKDKKDLIQDQFEFLRTDNGYKLISVTIRKGKIN